MRRGVLLFNVWEAKTVKSTQRHAAAAAGLFALALLGTPSIGVAQTPQPAQRGGPPNGDTPRILIATFKSDDRKLGVEASEAVRKRVQDQYSAKQLFVVPKQHIDETLRQSGYQPDSALSTSDLMELGKQVRADEVVDGIASKAAEGVKVEARLLLKRNQTILAQPLAVVTKEIERSLSEARKSLTPYKQCENDLRAAKYDAAIVSGRAAIAAFPNSTFGRLCLLTAFYNSKGSADSIIKYSEQILTFDKTSTIALGNAAEAYKTKGNIDKYIEYSLAIWRADPSNEGVARSIIQELASSGAPEKSLPIIEEILKVNPGDPQLLRQKWLVLLAAKQYKAALSAGEEMVKADTAAANLDYYKRMAAVAVLDNQPQLAGSIYAKGLQKFPNDADMHLAYAQVLAKSGQLQQALASAERAIAINPKIEQGQGYMYVLALQVQLGQLDAAKATAPKALAAGADKQKIADALLAVVAPVVAKANQTKSADDWEAVLKTSQDVDAIAPGPATKFYIGLAAYQIGAAALQRVNDYNDQLKKAKPAQQKEIMAKACADVKVAEDNFAITMINMPAGGAYQKETAGQVLGAVQQNADFLTAAKNGFCKPR
jgi:tetratricopeptide (TPR) repeat protein